MDLGAYAQIEELDKIVKANGIEVARCRGYRLMKDEKPMSEDEVTSIVEHSVFDAAEDEIRTDKYGCVIGSWETDRKCRKLLIGKKDKWYIETTGINWNKIHGKLRKRIKFAIKKAKRDALVQWKMWNKYAGCDDVLYIHAKLGSWSWSDIKWNNYKCEQWYLDGCDDVNDRAYCDIYARIDTNKTESKRDKTNETSD